MVYGEDGSTGMRVSVRMGGGRREEGGGRRNVGAGRQEEDDGRHENGESEGGGQKWNTRIGGH